MVGSEEHARTADIKRSAVPYKNFGPLIQRFIPKLTFNRKAAGATPLGIADLRSLKALKPFA
jgi:hypothetical protein